MLIRVASKAASAAHHLLVKVKAAAVIGLLDAQQQIIDLAFAEPQLQAAAAWRHDQETVADAELTSVDNAVCKSSGPAWNAETMSTLRSADGGTQASGFHSGLACTLAALLLQHVYTHC